MRSYLIKFSVAIASAGVLTLGLGEASQAVTLNEGIWADFFVGETNSSSDPFVFEFTAPEQGAVLKITDSSVKGDQFSVFDFDVLVGTTSYVPVDTSDPSGEPDASFADPTYSSATFDLGAGDHSLTVISAYTSDGATNGFIRWDAQASPTQATPEPLTLLGAGTALGFGAFFKRKLSSKQKKNETKA